MACLLIVIFIIFIVSFICFPIFAGMGLDLLGIIMFSLWILTPILFYILLAIQTKKYPKNSIEDYNDFRIYKSDSDITIFVSKENGYWVCKCQDKQVKLDLKGYLFRKAYILAYLNRQIKYGISHMTIRQFFKCKFKIKKYKNIDIYVVFEGKRKRILHNNILKQSILCQLISQIRYVKHYLFMKTAVSFSKEKVRKNVDEKDYINNNLIK